MSVPIFYMVSAKQTNHRVRPICLPISLRFGNQLLKLLLPYKIDLFTYIFQICINKNILSSQLKICTFFLMIIWKGANTFLYFSLDLAENTRAALQWHVLQILG